MKRQFNLNHHGNNRYIGGAEQRLREAQRERGYPLGVWLTLDQIRNLKGKYLYYDLRLQDEMAPIVVHKKIKETGITVETRLYNIDQTNFKEVYPGIYALLKQGMTTDEAVQILLRRPVGPATDSLFSRLFRK